MKKIITLLSFCSFLFSFTKSYSQTIAKDFTHNDCNGKPHHLFSTLDSGNVVIMEFYHTCASCVAAANDLKPMYQKLRARYGNRISFYTTPGEDVYNCASVLSWANSNGLSSLVTPFDSGAAQTAYYGGMGMPTIAIAAGSAHKLLYLANQTISFTTSDTGKIGIAIRHFLDSTLANISSLNVSIRMRFFPNPIWNNLSVSIEASEAGALRLDITDIAGHEVAKLIESKIQAGSWSKNFPVTLSNGVYFVRGSLNEKIFNEKITVQH